MNNEDKLREECSQFIRKKLPAIREASTTIKTIPSFLAKADERKKERHRFIETALPNWWQLPKGFII